MLLLEALVAICVDNEVGWVVCIVTALNVCTQELLCRVEGECWGCLAFWLI